MELRESRQVTYAEIARRLGLSGRARVGHWFSGAHAPDLDTLSRLADVLGVSPCWLAWGIDDPLADDERAMLRRYRAAPPSVRQAIVTLLPPDPERAERPPLPRPRYRR